MGHSPALVNALSGREKELAEITGRISAAQRDSVSARISKMREFVTGQLADIRQLLYSGVQKAKGEFPKHVHGIEMVLGGLEERESALVWLQGTAMCRTRFGFPFRLELSATC
jgi:hypothetical protein